MQDQLWQIEDYVTGLPVVEEVNSYKVTVLESGIPVFAATGEKVADIIGTKGIFVMDEELNLYFGPRTIHHSDFFRGAPVSCAGEFTLGNKKGTLMKLNNRSGHYMPEKSCLDLVDKVVRTLGYKKEIKYDVLEKMTGLDIIRGVNVNRRR